MPIIARGAEAVLEKECKEGKDILVKDRVAKGYRLKVIDEKLRRERTRGEARLLRGALRANVAVPRVLEEKGFVLVEEFIEGKRLKEFINESNENTIKRIAEQLGCAVAKLHSSGIIHGDLTTSNMILAENKVYFIDFGLGFFSDKTEDQGTDLAVLREAFQSTHFNFFEQLWNGFVAAYRKSFSGAEQSLKALTAIERRGRYVRRTA